MKNGMIMSSGFSCEVLVLELQLGMKYPEEGVKTQHHIAILTFKSYLGQHTTSHCTLDI